MENSYGEPAYFSLCSSPFSEKQYQKNKLILFHTKTSIPLKGSPFDVYDVACIMNFQGCFLLPMCGGFHAESA